MTWRPASIREETYWERIRPRPEQVSICWILGAIIVAEISTIAYCLIFR